MANLDSFPSDLADLSANRFFGTACDFWFPSLLETLLGLTNVDLDVLGSFRTVFSFVCFEGDEVWVGLNEDVDRPPRDSPPPDNKLLPVRELEVKVNLVLSSVLKSDDAGAR